MNPNRTLVPAILAAITVTFAIPVVSTADAYYTGEKVFALSPGPASIKPLSHIEPRGILTFVEQVVKVTIQQETNPDL